MKKLVVCGSTGTQGGSVIEVMKDVPDWKIVGFSRDVKNERAKELEDSGVEMHEGDLEDLNSLLKLFDGAQGVFGLTQPWNKSYTKADTAGELKQGRNIIDACKKAEVPHLVLSTASSMSEEKTGLPHVDVKLDIEAYGRESGIPLTNLKPAQFMDNIGMRFLPVKKGKIRGFIDGDAKVPYIATADIGRTTRIALENPQEHLGKEIRLLGDFISGNQLAASMGRLRGEAFRYTTVPKWIIWLISREFYKMRNAFEDFAHSDNAKDIPEEIDKCRAINPELMSVEQYLKSMGWDKKKL